jgi:DNA topoisomerase-1
VADTVKVPKNAANAQEAHEPIRPAILNDAFPPPSSLPAEMPPQTKALYDLIYRRTLASLMPPKVLNSTAVVLHAGEGEGTLTFRATGSVTVFDGFSRATGGDTGDKSGQPLPPLTEASLLSPVASAAVPHTTQPPPRYTEATFVKALEALGVGRPSTYASVISTLRSRGYVVATTPPRCAAPAKRARRRPTPATTTQTHLPSPLPRQQPPSHELALLA